MDEIVNRHVVLSAKTRHAALLLGVDASRINRIPASRHIFSNSFTSLIDINRPVPKGIERKAAIMCETPRSLAFTGAWPLFAEAILLASL